MHKKISVRHNLKRELKNKLSKRDSKKDPDKLIVKMRATVKKDTKVKEKFKEYGVPLSDIDKVHIEFKKLDVSAKTKDRKIYLNDTMLYEDSPVKDPTHYLVHELTHYLQQTTGKMKGHDADADYIDKPTEEEAFKAQIDFKKRTESPEEAERYTEDLLDHHDLEGKRREEKEKELLGE